MRNVECLRFLGVAPCRVLILVLPLLGSGLVLDAQAPTQTSTAPAPPVELQIETALEAPLFKKGGPTGLTNTHVRIPKGTRLSVLRYDPPHWTVTYNGQVGVVGDAWVNASDAVRQAAAALAPPPGETLKPAPPGDCVTGAIKLEMDRFSGETTGQTRLPWSTAMAVSMVWNSKSPDTFALLFSVVNNDWKYLACHPVYMLADGQPIRVEAVQHSGSVTDSARVIEQLTVLPNPRDVATLTNAKSFEFKICNDEFEADRRFLCEARDLIRAVKEWKVTQPKK